MTERIKAGYKNAKQVALENDNTVKNLYLSI